MARQSVFVSDLTGKVLHEPVKVKVETATNVYVLDADRLDDLVVEIVSHATPQKKRGRPRKVVVEANS